VASAPIARSRAAVAAGLRPVGDPAQRRRDHRLLPDRRALGVHVVVLHELLGRDDVTNYDGSWTAWGNMVNVPIEKD
jgi:hypothetical protein